MARGPKTRGASFVHLRLTAAGWAVFGIALLVGVATARSQASLLFVLFGVVALYISPSIHLVETWQESKQRRSQVTELRRENHVLRARQAALRDPRTLEREARRLGLVKPGERAYVVRGLPRDR